MQEKLWRWILQKVTEEWGEEWCQQLFVGTKEIREERKDLRRRVQQDQQNARSQNYQ